MENGLGSPLCGEGSALPAAARRNCSTSGFEAAGAPTGDYALDVHIDTAQLSFQLDVDALLQDYLVEPVWMGLVWVVHTLVVALEWCFTLDLLDSSALGGLEHALRETQAAFTGPWLVLALALAATAAAYNGLVRRRVAETLGQAALMLVMMGGGLWVIADPAGTVGALGRWVDEASVGTLGAVVQGTPARAPQTLAQSLGELFAGVVGAPWCYLEFGNVDWCEQPVRLQPRVHAAGLAIALLARGGACTGGEPSKVLCGALEGEPPRALAQSAELLQAAHTNGELFLALPANGPARNSLSDMVSLLRALCGGGEGPAGCRGPSAAEADFRTQSGTYPRIGGLLLIAIGALGMILLFGFIVGHLLGAEILSLLYLLLAPAAVIAPALGDSGRAAFRAWGTRLLGAVCSKLVFSFLLGVVLLLTRTLLDLDALGWWTRWLLVDVLWWGAYRERHHALGAIRGERRWDRSQGAQSVRPRSLARRVKERLETPTAVWPGAQWVYRKHAGGWGVAPGVERRSALERVGHRRAQAAAGEQAARMLEREHADASARARAAPAQQAELSAKRTQLQRVRAAQQAASAGGDTRRAAHLGVRAQRIAGEIEHGQRALNEARSTAAEGERAYRHIGRLYTSEQARERESLLDAQAALPAAARRRGVAGEPARDYAALAGLAGHGREQYEHLDPRTQREARLEIDRELALRRELNAAVGDLAAAGEPTPGRRERRRAGKAFDRALEEQVRRGGHAPPRSRGGTRRWGESREGSSRGGEPGERGSRPGAGAPRGGGATDAHRHDPRPHTPAGGRESSVMRDAREVARRRKRQLGG